MFFFFILIATIMKFMESLWLQATLWQLIVSSDINAASEMAKLPTIMNEPLETKQLSIHWMLVLRWRRTTEIKQQLVKINFIPLVVFLQKIVFCALFSHNRNMENSKENLRQQNYLLPKKVFWLFLRICHLLHFCHL